MVMMSIERRGGLNVRDSNDGGFIVLKSMGDDVFWHHSGG